MRIVIDSINFNITAEDLETAQENFTFWEGRRFNIPGNDLREHSLRFNDLVQGVLAENAIFEEGENKEQIYTALSHLKGQGYPYTGSREIRIMLWFKQLFGNYFREEKLAQLKSKLEMLSKNPPILEKPTTQARSSICSTTIPEDVLTIFFKYAGRAAYLQLVSTCKLFKEIIERDVTLKNHCREFKLLEKSFKLSKLTFPRPTQPNYFQNEIFLLLSAFNIKEVIKKVETLELGSGLTREYKIVQLQYAISLSRIDAKSAFKIVTLIGTPNSAYTKHRDFCAIAAIYRTQHFVIKK